MQDGIYHVHFSSSAGVLGEGLAVIKQGAVNGGDPGYVYTGAISLNGGTMSGRLNIKQWNPAVPSVFGPLKNFDLQLTGQSNGSNSFTAAGGVATQPNLTINIKGQFVSHAA